MGLTGHPSSPPAPPRHLLSCACLVTERSRRERRIWPFCSSSGHGLSPRRGSKLISAVSVGPPCQPRSGDRLTEQDGRGRDCGLAECLSHPPGASGPPLSLLNRTVPVAGRRGLPRPGRFADKGPGGAASAMAFGSPPGPRASPAQKSSPFGPVDATSAAGVLLDTSGRV
jgi:hypothetical protein